MFCPTDGSQAQQPQQTDKFQILHDYRPDFIEQYEAFLAQNNIKVAGIEAIRR